MSKLKYIIREDSSGEKFLEFYPIVFNHKSKLITQHGKKFFEVVEPVAFSGADTSNTIATLYHDKNKILGRTHAGTLSLTPDEKGLKASVLLGDITLHRDTIELVERGDLYECSFRASISDWIDKVENGETIRYIKKIEILKDVSIVSEGAYSDTDINVITREYSEKNDNDEMSEENKDEQVEDIKETEVEKEDKQPEEEKDIERELEDNKPSETEEEDKPTETKEDVEEEKNETEIKRSFQEKKENNEMIKNNLELIREAINTASAKNTIEITRAAGDGEVTNFTKLTPQSVAKLDIVGKSPIWAEMNIDYMPGCKGIITLPYESPMIAEQLAELASVTKQTETDNGTLVTAKRYQSTKIWTLETLSNLTNEGLEAQINNLRQSIDRKVTEDVFNAVFTGATAVAGVTAVDEAGIDSLASVVDIDNEYSFIMSRSMFYAKKSVKIDAGSGVNLLTKSGKFGETFDGDKVYFSTLSPVDNKVAGGDLSKVTVCDFDNEHVIIDNVTLSDNGQVKVTVVKMLAVALRNPNAFSVSGVIV